MLQAIDRSRLPLVVSSAVSQVCYQTDWQPCETSNPYDLLLAGEIQVGDLYALYPRIYR